MWKKILIALISVAVGLIGGWLLHRFCSQPATAEPVVLTDTITVRDTITLKGDLKFVTNFDTIVRTDSIRDTVVVSLPIEHRQFTKSFVTDTSNIDLTVNFSGYKARLDSVQLDYRFVVKPRVEPPNKVVHLYTLVGTSVHNLNTQRLTFGCDFKDRYMIGVTGIRYKNDITYTLDFGVRW